MNGHGGLGDYFLVFTVLIHETPRGIGRVTRDRVEHASVGLHVFGEVGPALLRREGVHEAELTAWQSAAEAALNDAGRRAPRSADAQRIHELERELRRKDAALAETAALLTKGKFTVKVVRALSPHGADRFYDLAAEGFFDESSFFRVVPHFIAQFGVNNDRKVNEAWDAKTIPDDSVKVPNARGTLVFATSGKDSRAHQLFVNLADNRNLDRQGFSPIGRVVEGMAVVDSIYSGYGEAPSYHLLSTLGNSYIKRMFPKIDYIRTAHIVAGK
ncbi:hypothetical protein BH09GEM1_BH09GEM1_34270 [soil metagenome]